MENLFSTSIVVNNQSVTYRVVFDKEKYLFISEKADRELSTFSFKREHDQWVDQQALPAEIKDQAIDALENYLLKQL